MPGDEFLVRIEQRYQDLSTSGERGGKALHVIGARLRGAEIRFTSFDRDGSVRHFEGRLQDGRLAGESEGPGVEPRRWSAVMQKM